MLPVLFSFGPLTISSFGLFLALSFLVALFIVWRLARAYDINEEKLSNIAILTFLGGILGARIFAVINNIHLYDSLEKILLINRYPGLSFWGGLVGATFTLWYFTKRAKLNFWQIADFAAVGAVIGIAIGNIGCFLGGCGYGIISDSIFATPVVGLVGKRFPISLIESIILLVVFLQLWKKVVRFHFAGNIAALFLIYLGVVKTFTEGFRGDSKYVTHSLPISYSHILSLALVVIGGYFYYSLSKRSITKDIKNIFRFVVSGSYRNDRFTAFKKYCYNQLVNWQVKLGKSPRRFAKLPIRLRRKLNVKPTPKDYL